MQKLVGFVTHLIKGRWQIMPAHTLKTLQAETERLEQILATPPPQPQSTRTKTSELQKFMDLAG
jgi:hypothetical protein